MCRRTTGRGTQSIREMTLQPSSYGRLRWIDHSLGPIHNHYQDRERLLLLVFILLLLRLLLLFRNVLLLLSKNYQRKSRPTPPSLEHRLRIKPPPIVHVPLPSNRICAMIPIGSPHRWCQQTESDSHALEGNRASQTNTPLKVILHTHLAENRVALENGDRLLLPVVESRVDGVQR